jgi:hypothetical protein
MCYRPKSHTAARNVPYADYTAPLAPPSRAISQIGRQLFGRLLRPRAHSGYDAIVRIAQGSSLCVR